MKCLPCRHLSPPRDLGQQSLRLIHRRHVNLYMFSVLLQQQLAGQQGKLWSQVVLAGLWFRKIILRVFSEEHQKFQAGDAQIFRHPEHQLRVLHQEDLRGNVNQVALMVSGRRVWSGRWFVDHQVGGALHKLLLKDRLNHLQKLN